MTESDGPPPPPAAPHGDAPAPAVRFVRTDLGYEGRTVVRHLDLTIATGQVVGLLGPNGSGKSTVIGSLVGLATVQRGRVELFGIPRDRFAPWARVGYVPQRHTLGGGLPATVTEVVSTGRLGRLRPFPRLGADGRAAVTRAIDAVGLGPQAHRPVGELSGGQQRRTLIARALVSAPDLLLLDEPTAGVDRASQEGLAETLAAVAATGATIVLVTHELGPVTPIVTRAVVLRDGRVVHDGPATTAPDEHDDDWHHHHGDPPRELGDLGLAAWMAP